MSKRPRTSPSYFRKCHCAHGRNLAFYLPAKYFLDKATKLLTVIASIQYRCCVAVSQLDHVLQRMQKALEEKSKRVYALNDELIELAPKYERFLEVNRQMERDQDLIDKLRAVLASPHKMDLDERGKGGYKLWELIEVYLRYVREAQVGNIAHFLEWIGLTSNRQAIESAINTHKETFEIEKRGREKFISLREENNAPSTKTKRKH
jgi:hypothetical protein